MIVPFWTEEKLTAADYAAVSALFGAFVDEYTNETADNDKRDVMQSIVSFNSDYALAASACFAVGASSKEEPIEASQKVFYSPDEVITKAFKSGLPIPGYSEKPTPDYVLQLDEHISEAAREKINRVKEITGLNPNIFPYIVAVCLTIGIPKDLITGIFCMLKMQVVAYYCYTMKKMSKKM
jgi:hypothetical protein